MSVIGVDPRRNREIEEKRDVKKDNISLFVFT